MFILSAVYHVDHSYPELSILTSELHTQPREIATGLQFGPALQRLFLSCAPGYHLASPPDRKDINTQRLGRRPTSQLSLPLSCPELSTEQQLSSTHNTSHNRTLVRACGFVGILGSLNLRNHELERPGDIYVLPSAGFSPLAFQFLG